jgi:hypothetical protein
MGALMKRTLGVLPPESLVSGGTQSADFAVPTKDSWLLSETVSYHGRVSSIDLVKLPRTRTALHDHSLGRQIPNLNPLISRTVETQSGSAPQKPILSIAPVHESVASVYDDKGGSASGISRDGNNSGPPLSLIRRRDCAPVGPK